MPENSKISAWFAGPKAENSERFADIILRILADHQYWRRNYFPEDGVVVDSHLKRQHEEFNDEFDDRLLELLARLKADFPFQSPRYAAHMLSEQTLPSIAGYFAAMLYNPNNVTSEVAPVTVKLEIEAAQMIARMLGYGEGNWAHLTGGGTVANFEALWVARSAKYLPFVVAEMREALGLPVESGGDKLALPPLKCLQSLEKCFAEASANGRNAREVIEAFRAAKANVALNGMGKVCSLLGSEPVLLAPETHHYCLQKALDLLGIGQSALVRVKVDSDFRMDVVDLAAKIGASEESGKHVLAVVAIMGSTEEGALDPLNEILDMRHAREMEGKSSFWLHADAAYGGYLRTITIPGRLGLGDPFSDVTISGEKRRIALHLPEHSACNALERLGEADSIVIDPHKLGYIPYPAGAVCFKTNLVKPLVRQDAPYLEDAPDAVEAERESDAIGVYILEGSKPGAAAAAVWLSHKLIPLDNTGHGLLVRETVRNACEFHSLLEQWEQIKGAQPVRAVPLCPPGSNIVCYAFCPTDRSATLAEINDLNRKLYRTFSLSREHRKHIQDQRFFVSRTVLSSGQYGSEAVSGFLARLGVDAEEYGSQGVFLLRSVFMNPWYSAAKRKGRYFISELVEELFTNASGMV